MSNIEKINNDNQNNIKQNQLNYQKLNNNHNNNNNNINIVSKTSKIYKYIKNDINRYNNNFFYSLKEDFNYMINFIIKNRIILFWLFICIIVIDNQDTNNLIKNLMYGGAINLNINNSSSSSNSNDKITKKELKQAKKTAKKDYLEKTKESIKTKTDALKQKGIFKSLGRTSSILKGQSAVSWGKLYSMFERSFYIIGIIFIIIGVISLPILIILTFTYYIIKKLISKISNL